MNTWKKIFLYKNMFVLNKEQQNKFYHKAFTLPLKKSPTNFIKYTII